MNRFPILKFLSWVLRILGWAFVALSVYYGVSSELKETLTVTSLLFVVGFFVVGLVVSMLGELIGVLFAIEDNTFKLANIDVKSRKLDKNLEKIVAYLEEGKLVGNVD